MRSPPTVLLVGGGAAYALVAASTTPFTVPADVLTGLAIVGMAVLVIVRWPLHTRAARSTSPLTVDPSTVDPNTADPLAADPGVANPGVAIPAAADPGVANPAGADPGVANPAGADPGVANPAVADPGVASPTRARASTHPYLPWVLILVVFTAWEFFNYLVHGSRADHPTFSSITDANDRFYLLKAALFLGWLAAAVVIVRRGRRQRPARRVRVHS